jgi:ankyrin repeat protein
MLQRQKETKQGIVRRIFRRLFEPLKSDRLRKSVIDEEKRKLGYMLDRAAENGDNREVRRLLSLGADVNFRSLLGWTPLFGAAREGRTETCALLLENGADIGARDELDRTAFMIAAHFGMKETCAFLESKGANLESRDADTYAALRYAAEMGRTSICAFLADKIAERGGDINARSDGGCTAFLYAAKNGHMVACALLIGKGADPDARGNGSHGNNTALAYARAKCPTFAWTGNFPKTVKFLELLPLLQAMVPEYRPFLSNFVECAKN